MVHQENVELYKKINAIRQENMELHKKVYLRIIRCKLVNYVNIHMKLWNLNLMTNNMVYHLSLRLMDQGMWTKQAEMPSFNTVWTMEKILISQSIFNWASLRNGLLIHQKEQQVEVKDSYFSHRRKKLGNQLLREKIYICYKSVSFFISILIPGKSLGAAELN